MKTKTLSMMMACAMSIGIGMATVPTNAWAAAETPAPVVAQPGQILTMKQVATIFLERYPYSAIHSMTLYTKGLKAYYKVTGYTVKNTYTCTIDCVSGTITNWEVDGPEKHIAKKIFNPAQILDPVVAQDKAMAYAGEGAIAKQWTVSANDGETVYSILIHQGENKQIIKINAYTGALIGKSYPMPIEMINYGNDPD